jgi:hypothetical protein
VQVENISRTKARTQPVREAQTADARLKRDWPWLKQDDQDDDQDDETAETNVHNLAPFLAA